MAQRGAVLGPPHPPALPLGFDPTWMCRRRWDEQCEGLAKRGEKFGSPPCWGEQHPPAQGRGKVGEQPILGDPLSLPPAAVDPVICKLPRGFPSPASQRSLLSVFLWGRPKSRTRGADFPGGGDSPASPTPCEVIKAPALSPYVWGGGPKGCPLPEAPLFLVPPLPLPQQLPRAVASPEPLGWGLVGAPKHRAPASGAAVVAAEPRSLLGPLLGPLRAPGWRLLCVGVGTWSCGSVPP